MTKYECPCGYIYDPEVGDPDSGIAPGSGVKNKRREISKATLNTEVIAIGVPTVTEYPDDNENLIVTPKECDILTDKLSEIIARFLNLYLQPEIERYDFKLDVIMASGLGAPLGLDGVLSGTDIDW